MININQSQQFILHKYTILQKQLFKPKKSLINHRSCTVKSSTEENQTQFYRVNLDYKHIKENNDLYERVCIQRNVKARPALVLKLYQQYLSNIQQIERLRFESNNVARSMKGRLEKDQRQQLIQQGFELKKEIQILEEKSQALELELQLEAVKLPNLIHPSVPVGNEQQANIIDLVGEKPSFSFPVQNHIEIGVELDLIDFEKAAEVSGSKFYYLKNACALLEIGLINYAMQKIVQKGFSPMITPDLVRQSTLEKCGFHPRGESTQVYSVEKSDLCLTGTAEVPLGGYYMDQIIEEDQLPIKIAGFGRCFRQEAGGSGQESKGLYRVHQFSKVEMFIFCKPEQSEQQHQELKDIEIEIFQELGLHFKVLDMPSEDLGAPAYRKFDIEAWMPGLERYGEISSASNCTDYQSRRLNIRYRPNLTEDEKRLTQQNAGKKVRKPNIFVHTLNGTACAIPRIIVSILENFQQQDGSVLVPKVLQPYLGGLSVIQK